MKDRLASDLGSNSTRDQINACEHEHSCQIVAVGIQGFGHRATGYRALGYRVAAAAAGCRYADQGIPKIAQAAEEEVASTATRTVVAAGHTEAGVGHNLAAAQETGNRRREGSRQARAIDSQCFPAAYSVAAVQDMVSLRAALAGLERHLRRQRPNALREAFGD